MLKNISRFEYKTGDRTYQFLCDMDSPLNEVKEALFQFTKYVGSVEDYVKAQAEVQKSAEEKKQDDKHIEIAS